MSEVKGLWSFKVLVVLQGVPVASPSESVLHKQAVAEVAALQLVGRCLATIGIACAGSRLYDGHAAFLPDAGIVERVDVYGHSQGVLGQPFAARHLAEAEAGGVVGRHRALVVSIIVIDECHALYGVAGFVETAEDVEQVRRYGFVAHQLTLLRMSVGIAMKHTEKAQVGTCHRASLRIALASHTTEHLVAEGIDAESLRHLASDRKATDEKKEKQGNVMSHIIFNFRKLRLLGVKGE